MLTRWLEFTVAHWPEWVAVALSAIGYLVVDLHPQVKSLRALVRTFSFYILIVCFIVLNLISYGGVRVAWGAKIDRLVGSTSFLAIVVLSTTGTLAFLQSLTIKLGGKKFVSLERIIDSYRARVLQDASQKDAELKRRDADHLADRLAKRFEQAQLRTDYIQVMSWAGRDDEAIEKDLVELQATAKKLEAKFERLLAFRMASTDPAMVRAILDRKS